ncbi:hypothetical protein MHF_1475 [Mycoplasma haemofelis Ohio2]|uniref:Uncharacterized protein n=1 Tax=Mycoplasma haemofelis (strain Ohio2) TaxID=859194 RepID=F6FH00_MYCHI|nr:hypothetical protein MHF_1475 [Mycoplasma haemofelis Ohio2]
MTTSGKIAAATMAAGGTGTAGFFAVKNLQSHNPISSKIDTKYLLKKTDTTQWAARVATLKTAQDKDITPELKNLKSKEGLKEQDLQEWCASSLQSEFSDKSSIVFKNILSYCAYNLGDKVTGDKITDSTTEGESKLTTIWNSITSLNQNSEISEGLKKVKDTENGNSNNAGNKAIKAWCLGQFKIPYYENDSDLKESQDYCVLK